MNLRLIKLDILAKDTSIFKVKVKSKDQKSPGSFVASTKCKYKIEAPIDHQAGKNFAAELEF